MKVLESDYPPCPCEVCEENAADVVVTRATPLPYEYTVCAACALSGIEDGACVW